jgi:hypothetical protein
MFEVALCQKPGYIIITIKQVEYVLISPGITSRDRKLEFIENEKSRLKLFCFNGC